MKSLKDTNKRGLKSDFMDRQLCKVANKFNPWVAEMES